MLHHRGTEFPSPKLVYKGIYDKVKEILEIPDDNEYASKIQMQRLKLRKGLPKIRFLEQDALELYKYYKDLLEEVRALEKESTKYYNIIVKAQDREKNPYAYTELTKDEERELSSTVQRRQKILKIKEKEVSKLEQEYLIKQEDLQTCIRETNLARTSYYHLTDAEIELFEVDRPKILAGVEKYGSVSAAVKNDASIKSRLSSILYYANKHDQFKQDIAIAQQVFKDMLDAEIMDRAINGTKNPVFQRGEYIGDYAVRDNKLLVEVAKAKLQEQYNPRAYAQAHPQQHQGTTINILSFDGVDETKRGYTKNVGVVTSVDETGKVERITQDRNVKKMIEFYKKKGTAEIIEASAEAPTSPEKADEIIEGIVCTEGGEDDVLE